MWVGSGHAAHFTGRSGDGGGVMEEEVGPGQLREAGICLVGVSERNCEGRSGSGPATVVKHVEIGRASCRERVSSPV